LRTHRDEDFKNDFLMKNWNKVCHYHYFADLYKYKKTTNYTGGIKKGQIKSKNNFNSKKQLKKKEGEQQQQQLVKNILKPLLKDSAIIENNNNLLPSIANSVNTVSTPTSSTILPPINNNFTKPSVNNFTVNNNIIDIVNNVPLMINDVLTSTTTTTTTTTSDKSEISKDLLNLSNN